MSHGDGMTDPTHETGGDGFAWRPVDADVAELAYDSVADRSLAVAVRGSEGIRLLTFEAQGLTVEVQVTALGTRRHMIGQLIPNRQARVMVRHQDGIATVDADRSGRFRVDDLPSGPGSLRCHLGGDQAGAPVVTDWVML
jgi:hypothetical protein